MVVVGDVKMMMVNGSTETSASNARTVPTFELRSRTYFRFLLRSSQRAGEIRRKAWEVVILENVC